MAIGDVYRVDYMVTNDDKLTMSSLHYEEVVETNGTVLEVTTDICQQSEVKFWSNFWEDYASIQATYLQTKCQKIFPVRDVPFFSTALTGNAGIETGDAMNGTTAVIIALYGQTWSPHFRGRAFLPGLAESLADAGRLTGLPLGNIQGGATTFYEAAIIITAPATGSFLPVIYSPTLAGPPPAAEVTSFIDTVVVRPRIGTQRSRRTLIQSAS